MICNNHNGWTDLDPRPQYKPPHCIIPAAEIAASIRQGHDDYDIYMFDRKCIYDDGAGNKYPLILEFRIATAALVTIGGGTEGRMITTADVLSTAPLRENALAGVSLGAYYSQAHDDFEVDIDIGDGYWTVRSGLFPCNFTAVAVAIGDIVTLEAGAATGNFEEAIAMAGITADLEENLFHFEGVGICAETVGVGGGLGNVRLMLPPTFRQVA